MSVCVLLCVSEWIGGLWGPGFVCQCGVELVVWRWWQCGVGTIGAVGDVAGDGGYGVRQGSFGVDCCSACSRAVTAQIVQRGNG